MSLPKKSRDVEFKVQRHKPKECPENSEELLQLPREHEQPDYGYQSELITLIVWTTDLAPLVSRVYIELNVCEFFEAIKLNLDIYKPNSTNSMDRDFCIMKYNSQNIDMMI